MVLRKTQLVYANVLVKSLVHKMLFFHFKLKDVLTFLDRVHFFLLCIYFNVPF
jgi:hypothetical protein